MKLTLLNSRIFCILVTAITLPSLFGSILVPGATVTPDAFTSTAYTVLATTGPLTINPIPGTSFNATYTETVARATTSSGGLCVGCLDFFITVSNAGLASSNGFQLLVLMISSLMLAITPQPVLPGALRLAP